MPDHPRQLPLPLELRRGSTFAEFVDRDNPVPRALVERVARAHGEPQVLLWGAPGTGKTHLLQAACREALEAGDRAAWWPLSALAPHEGHALVGLEALDLLCLDELELSARGPALERAVFGLINRCRTQGCRLLLAARARPCDGPWRLPDLRSRLAWGPVIQLARLDDAGRREAVQRRARSLGWTIPGPALEYLLVHCPRDMVSLMTMIDALDRESLELRRPITPALVRRILERCDLGEGPPAHGSGAGQAEG